LALHHSLGIGILPIVIVRSAGSIANEAAEDAAGAAAASPQPLPQESKRVFGIIPNNRTSPGLKDYKPLSPKAKSEIASQDSFDRGAVVLAAAFAAEAQLTRADPSFGQGRQGYGRYFGTAYCPDTSGVRAIR
jgi:hypothetical protein